MEQEEKPPIIFNEDESQTKAPRRASEARHEKSDRWMIALTALIAVGGIISAIIFFKQLSVMQGQLDAMEADQRPWVFATNVIISRPVVHDDKGLHISLRFDLKNGGHSPALQTSARFRAYFGSVHYRDEEQIVCKDAQPEGFGTTLFVDQTDQPETSWLIPADQIEVARKSGVILTPFVVACVSYQLPRARAYRTTPYEFVIQPALGSTKWPCCNFPIDEREIAPSDLRLTFMPVSPPT